MDFFSIFHIISLILFLGIFIGRSVWLQLKGVPVFVKSETKSVSKILMMLVFIAILFLWINEIVFHSTGISRSFLPDFLSKKIIDLQLIKTVGAILIFVGFIIFISGLSAMGKSWRMGMNHSNQGELITSGIFSLTRNPVFIFINLYFAGTALLITTWFFIFLTVMCMVGVHFFIIKEEKFMQQHYGEKYFEYCKKVRRYF